MDIRIKRIYEPPEASDGVRILVDRLWPRGISKERAALDHWFRDIAPSDDLRKWYQHEHAKWDEFRERYFTELEEHLEEIEEIRALCHKGPVTLLFSSKEEEFNNAAALRILLKS